MFKAGELEAISMALEPQFRELEQRIMSDIVRRISINGEITRAADWQVTRLAQLGESKREIKKAIKDTLGLSTAVQVQGQDTDTVRREPRAPTAYRCCIKADGRRAEEHHAVARLC